MIGLLGIINACWGAGIHEEGFPWTKWAYGPLVALAVFAWTLDPILSIEWGVFFLAWRNPALSRTGFQVFIPVRGFWWKGTKFFLMRWQIPALALLVIGIIWNRPELLAMAAVPTITAIIYSGLGRLYPTEKTARVAEYLTGLAIGGLITISWMAN